MGLLDRLKSLCCRLGLIRIVPQRIEAPKKITPRVTSLKELKTQVLQEESHPLHDELSAPFEKVFQDAGVEHRAWTVERLRDLLRTDPFRSMNRVATRQALLQTLAAENTRVEDLVQDARSRNKALDMFDTRALTLVRERQGLREREREALERQIRQLNEAGQQDQQALQQWQVRKTAYKKDMVWAIGFLIENPDEFRVESTKTSPG